MTEHPIIMGAESVRAILYGRKTMTRRVINNPKEIVLEAEHRVITIQEALNNHPDFAQILRCPYGSIGDRLWVKETWLEDRLPQQPSSKHGVLHYKANGYTHQIIVDSWDGYWCSPIYMPRWASRITLEITDLRAERLQDITPEDVEAEGVGLQSWACDPTWPPTAGYAQLWDSLNAKRGHPWSANPWVWAITFKRLEDK